ncbi:MAG: hypothetical protein FJ244_07665 [Nitrospira sp.]|nr:hypothetical protein [Nitrospira sp.]
MEVLPLSTKHNEPITKDRFRSKDRFLAVREAWLNPASLPEGIPVTVIGTVTGETTRLLIDQPPDRLELDRG